MPPRQAPGLGGEWRASVEFGRLLTDPVYYGIGVPRGDGRPVVVVPGLFANDLYLEPCAPGFAASVIGPCVRAC